MGRPAPPLPNVLLGLLTVATLGGPLAFGSVLRGGPRPDWPPDRAVEWWALALITALVLGLMSATIAAGWTAMRAPTRTPRRG